MSTFHQKVTKINKLLQNVCNSLSSPPGVIISFIITKVNTAKRLSGSGAMKVHSFVFTSFMLLLMSTYVYLKI